MQHTFIFDTFIKNWFATASMCTDSGYGRVFIWVNVMKMDSMNKWATVTYEWINYWMNLFEKYCE